MNILQRGLKMKELKTTNKEMLRLVKIIPNLKMKKDYYNFYDEFIDENLSREQILVVFVRGYLGWSATNTAKILKKSKSYVLRNSNELSDQLLKARMVKISHYRNECKVDPYEIDLVKIKALAIISREIRRRYELTDDNIKKYSVEKLLKLADEISGDLNYATLGYDGGPIHYNYASPRPLTPSFDDPYTEN